MGFLKKFAFGTIFSTGALITYWYHYPRNFYQNYKFVNNIINNNVNRKIENPRRPPSPPY